MLHLWITSSTELCWYAKISSSFYRDRYDAEEEIKTMAKYLGCTHIVNLRWRSDTGEEEGPKGGTHIYTVWQAIGYAAK